MTTSMFLTFKRWLLNMDVKINAESPLIPAGDRKVNPRKLTYDSPLSELHSSEDDLSDDEYVEQRNNLKAIEEQIRNTTANEYYTFTYEDTDSEVEEIFSGYNDNSQQRQTKYFLTKPNSENRAESSEEVAQDYTKKEFDYKMQFFKPIKDITMEPVPTEGLLIHDSPLIAADRSNEVSNKPKKLKKLKRLIIKKQKKNLKKMYVKKHAVKLSLPNKMHVAAAKPSVTLAQNIAISAKPKEIMKNVKRLKPEQKTLSLKRRNAIKQKLHLKRFKAKEQAVKSLLDKVVNSSASPSSDIAQNGHTDPSTLDIDSVNPTLQESTSMDLLLHSKPEKCQEILPHRYNKVQANNPRKIKKLKKNLKRIRAKDHNTNFKHHYVNRCKKNLKRLKTNARKYSMKYAMKFPLLDQMPSSSLRNIPPSFGIAQNRNSELSTLAQNSVNSLHEPKIPQHLYDNNKMINSPQKSPLQTWSIQVGILDKSSTEAVHANNARNTNDVVILESEILLQCCVAESETSTRRPTATMATQVYEAAVDGSSVPACMYNEVSKMPKKLKKTLRHIRAQDQKNIFKHHNVNKYKNLKCLKTNANKYCMKHTMKLPMPDQESTTTSLKSKSIQQLSEEIDEILSYYENRIRPLQKLQQTWSIQDGNLDESSTEGVHANNARKTNDVAISFNNCDSILQLDNDTKLDITEMCVAEVEPSAKFTAAPNAIQVYNARVDGSSVQACMNNDVSKKTKKLKKNLKRLQSKKHKMRLKLLKAKKQSPQTHKMCIVEGQTSAAAGRKKNTSHKSKKAKKKLMKTLRRQLAKQQKKNLKLLNVIKQKMNMQRAQVKKEIMKKISLSNQLRRSSLRILSSCCGIAQNGQTRPSTLDMNPVNSTVNKMNSLQESTYMGSLLHSKQHTCQEALPHLYDSKQMFYPLQRSPLQTWSTQDESSIEEVQANNAKKRTGRKKILRSAKDKPSKERPSAIIAPQACAAEDDDSSDAGQCKEVSKPKKLKINLKRLKAKAKEQVVKCVKTPMPDKMPRSLSQKILPNSNIGNTTKSKQEPKCRKIQKWKISMFLRDQNI